MLEESLEFAFPSAVVAAMVEVLPLGFVLEMMILSAARKLLATPLREVEPASRLVLAAELPLLGIALDLVMSSAVWAAVAVALWEESSDRVTPPETPMASPTRSWLSSDPWATASASWTATGFTAQALDAPYSPPPRTVWRPSLAPSTTTSR